MLFHVFLLLFPISFPFLPLREVLIALLRAKAAMVAASAAAGAPGMGVGLKRGEIMEAAKIALKADVPVHVYQKVGFRLLGG